MTPTLRVMAYNPRSSRLESAADYAYWFYGLGCHEQGWSSRSLPYGILTFLSSIVLAYPCLKLYDEPVRKWLEDKFE